MSDCKICGRCLDNEHDPLSRDCGGDCLKCMADAGDPDCLDQLWVFSFGQDHAHSIHIDGYRTTFDADTNLGIVGSCDATREKMFEYFGPKWAMQYRIDNYNPEYFPRGIIKWINA